VVPLIATLGFLSLLLSPEVGGLVVIELRAGSVVVPIPTPGTLANGTAVAGAAACRSTMTASTPGGPAPARAAVSVVEPRGCPTRTRLVFFPGLGVQNTLPVSAGHVLRASLTLVSLSGTTAMLRTVRIYLQQSGGANPIVTATPIAVRNGVATTSQSSNAVLGAASSYVLGVRINLLHQATVSSATLDLLIVFDLQAGGTTRAQFQEWIGLTLTY
jgi:hypothetical protein